MAKAYPILFAAISLLPLVTFGRPAHAGALNETEVLDITNRTDSFLYRYNPDIPFQAGIFKIIRKILDVVPLLAVAAIMFGGFLYITALDDESKTRRGKQAVIYASVGLMVASLSVLLVNIFVGVVNEAESAKSTPRELIVNLLMQILAPLAIIAFSAVCYGGFLYITSAGNEDKSRRGKMVLLYSGVGLALVMLSVLIVNLILRFNTTNVV